MFNICFVRYDITEKSGADRVAASLSNELSAFFHVHLFSLCGKGEKPFYPIDEKVTYFAALPGHDRIRKVALGGCKTLRQYVKDKQIDVVLAVGGSVIPFVWGATVGRKAKAVFCEHLNLEAVSNQRSNRLFRKMAAMFFDKIVTLTQRDRLEYQKRYLLDDRRVEYIYNWVDDALLTHKSDYNPASRKIITVGRFEPEKGYDILVETAGLVFAKHPDWQWDVYGGGQLVEQIQALIEAKELENNLHLMGVSNEIYSLYPQYALYVMTSRYEGLPLVLLEAKANGLPIVSFDCMTGPAEIVEDQVSGFLVPPENSEMLAGKICTLIEDEALRIAFSGHAHDNVHLFDKQVIIQKWVCMLEAICNETTR